MCGIAKDIKVINEKTFSKYGSILEKKPEGEREGNNLFRIVTRSKSDGWRAAYLVVRDRSISKLENHPDSKETFEPARGCVILCVSLNKNPEEFEVFILDKPVVLNEGIWHGIITLSEESEVKICENIEVGIEYHNLESSVKPVLIYEK